MEKNVLIGDRKENSITCRTSRTGGPKKVKLELVVDTETIVSDDIFYQVQYMKYCTPNLQPPTLLPLFNHKNLVEYALLTLILLYYSHSEFFFYQSPILALTIFLYILKTSTLFLLFTIMPILSHTPTNPLPSPHQYVLDTTISSLTPIVSPLGGGVEVAVRGANLHAVQDVLVKVDSEDLVSGAICYF